MVIKVDPATDPGKRDYNQDSFLVDKEFGLYIVADGMGGHAGGEVASRAAADEVARYLHLFEDDLRVFRDTPSSRRQLERLVRHAIMEASEAVYRMAVEDPELGGMGTTLTMIVVRENMAVMGHVGDSRLYLLRDKEFHQLSEDHTFVWDLIRQGMPMEQAKTSGMSHVLTRAVGFQAKVEVDTLTFDLLEGDQLLLCSDGLVGHVDTPPELAPMLLEHRTAKEFITFAIENESTDNITALVLEVLHDAPDIPAAKTRKAHVNHKLGALKRLWLFSRLKHRELALVTSYMSELEVAKDDVVIREGEKGNKLYVVLSGSLSVQRHDVEIAELEQRDHFGEMALVSGRSRNATVTATCDSRLLVMSRKDFKAILDAYPRLGNKLLWTISETLIDRLSPT